MKNINGFTTEQTLEFLNAYLNEKIDFMNWSRYPICSFITMYFLARRHKIMLIREQEGLKQAIWQFVAYWYNELGYHLPADAGPMNKLFNEFEGEALWRKVEVRKEFIDKVINNINTLVLEENQQSAKY